MRESAIVIEPGMITHAELLRLIKKEDKTFSPIEEGGWQIQILPYSKEISAVVLVAHSFESNESDITYVHNISIFSLCAKTIAFIIEILKKHDLAFSFESEAEIFEKLDKLMGDMIKIKLRNLPN